MYIGFYNYYKTYNNNRMLLNPSSPIGDNLNYPFVLLANKLKELGHHVATIDTDDITKFDLIIFIEFPGAHNKYFKKLTKKGFKNMHLLLLESPMIKPDNYDKANHGYFKKVFTWSDTLVDNIKYFKINYSHNIPEKLNFDRNATKKLCTLISSNKLISGVNELYSERIRAIRWFEKNHPESFDLYGKGWDKYHFEGVFLGLKLARLNRLIFLAKLLAPYYPSYKGSVESKKETYQTYAFSLCYENVKDFPGYITEKIFDCFLGGCVPIYLGANNIADHIPQNSFIDKRKFNTYEELYSYIKNMKKEEYLSYISAIENFLKSEKALAFSAEYFANTIIKNII
ncbi:MAG: hypothetical protein FJZ43_01955 [Candidatus Staskawiczbacteria bacterium]|nr:hypothetical protein [Candidatus Staskawiczbacteria bacterium]